MFTARDREDRRTLGRMGAAWALGAALALCVVGCDGSAGADAGNTSAPAPGGAQVVQAGLTTPPSEEASLPEPAAAPQRAPGDGPRASFTKTFHDFGTIDDAQPVTVEFKFVNAGNAPLEILKVNSSCGCTAAAPSKTVYEAGEEGAITVTFKPQGRNGAQHKSVRVETNDATNKTVTLKISSDVLAAITITPRLVNFNNVERGLEKKERFEVRLRGGESKVTSVEVEGGLVTAAIVEEHTPEPTDEHPSSVTTVEVTLSPEAPSGWLERKVRVSTNMNETPTVDVLATGTILGSLEVQPAKLPLGVVRSGVAFQRELRLVHRKGDLFNLVDAKVECDKNVEMVVKALGEIGPDGVAIMRLQVSGVGPAEAGEMKGNIVITTNVKDEGPITVPFNCVVRPAAPK